MAGRTLQECRILVAEDEYLLADDLAQALEQEGAVPLGPAACVEEALALIASEPRIDLALLDVNLGGEMAFAVADALIERGILFAFTTGYDRHALPSRFADVLRIEKPFSVQRVPNILSTLLYS